MTFRLPVGMSRAFIRSAVPHISVGGHIGGLIGGLLLLVTSQDTFSRIVPWLMLFATASFAAGLMPGRYKITVVATDKAGNRTKVVAVVRIAEHKAGT